MLKFKRFTIISVIILNVVLVLLVVLASKPKAFEPTNGYYNELTDYSNGSWTYVSVDKNIFEFQPVELGDFCYNFENEQALNNSLAIYKKNVENPTNLIKDVQQTKTYNENGNTIIEYNNGSFAMYNIDNNLFQFIPIEMYNLENGDYFPINCKDMKEFDNCIKTYQSMKLNGYF